jgi:ribulose 1,5-bisphosphate synthetase/thiazole synthase
MGGDIPTFNGETDFTIKTLSGRVVDCFCGFTSFNMTTINSGQWRRPTFEDSRLFFHVENRSKECQEPGNQHISESAWPPGLYRNKSGSRFSLGGNVIPIITESARKTPVLAETDVLVVGSGPGGLAAALAAAREGVRTILLERTGCFGGMITQAGVESIAWYRHAGTVDIQGIGIEFEQRARQMGATDPEPQSQSEALNTELFKVVADTLLEEAGIVPLLHCMAVEAVKEGDTIKGIITESKSGRQAILAQRVIDATGDADIAHLAGAPWRMAPKNERLGVTVSFSLNGVDRERFLAYVNTNPATIKDWGVETTGKEDAMFSPYLSEPFQRAKAAGDIPEGVEIAGTWSRLSGHGDATYINVVYMPGYDVTDVRDLTRGEIEGRRQALWAFHALKKYTPGFENATLRTFGASLGTRESRKIVGRTNLTEHDVRHQGRFDDAVGIFPEFIDGYGVVVLPTTGRYFQVPYGIMVPRKVENLLVAGRCVAGDRISHAATRAMMCCAVTGQAAGVAAALSLHNGVTCSQVDIGLLQKRLINQGVRIQ